MVARVNVTILAIVLLLDRSASAQGANAPTDLVGRNGQFTVKDKSGKVETVDPKQLRLPTELLPSAPRAVISDADGGEAGSGESAPPKAPGTKAGPAAKAKAAAPKEETPEEKAVRAGDVEALRAMRKQGGAYFYTEDNAPVSFEEIDRRIAVGDVEGLKAVGLHLEDWTPETKSKSARGGESTTAPAAQEPAPKGSKKY